MNSMNVTDTVRRVAKEIQLDHSRTLGPVVYHGPLMLPFLRDGDLLIVAPACFAEIHVGDIITFRDGEKFPTSRLIEKSSGLLIVKSDNFPVPRDVPATDVLGRVEERHRGNCRIRRQAISWRLRTRFILMRLSVARFRARLSAKSGGF
jgi:hypothetical protein